MFIGRVQIDMRRMRICRRGVVGFARGREFFFLPVNGSQLVGGERKNVGRPASSTLNHFRIRFNVVDGGY